MIAYNNLNNFHLEIEIKISIISSFLRHTNNKTRVSKQENENETLLTHHHASGTHHFTQHICFLSLNKKRIGKKIFLITPRKRENKTEKQLKKQDRGE